ncbi:MAG TPA: GNAT family N-acetyltransferase [Pilimelia sp.]|nr:GNAT family N-acetyltransferase [Pilimelia sp.]
MVAYSGPGIDLAAAVRALRRAADLSQRELAAVAGVPQSTVARIEAGRAADPSFRTVERLTHAAGGRVTMTPPAPTGPPPPDGDPALRDRAGRRFPAHLDAAAVTRPEQWWGAWWTLTMIRSQWPLEDVPAATYDLNRWRRDIRRERLARARLVEIARVLLPGVAERGWLWRARVAGGDTVGELWAHRRLTGDQCGDPPAAVVLDGVTVAPRWRDLGVGRRLVRALVEEVAEPAGLPVVALPEAPAAEAFLDRCGFVVTWAGPRQWVHPARDARSVPGRRR